MEIVLHDPLIESPEDCDMVIVGEIESESVWLAQFFDDTVSFKKNYALIGDSIHLQPNEIAFWYKVPEYHDLLAELRK